MNLFELFVKIGVDDQASGKLKDLSGKLGNGLKTAAKIGTAAVGAAAAGITALTTAAVNNYAEYEQLVGGVETLFENSADRVQQYAANAYKTAGLSANEYMETVTSFSASLLQSLGDDTEAAAEYADLAIRNMSDNANKMGTSMEMIQNAYQGFAKQNYTMLDNLKLGYGGTKTEMERLIADAAKLDSSIRANDLSFGNIVKAIDAVQRNMKISGITYEEYTELVKSGAMTQEKAYELLGTTVKEASGTISGSIGMMKASWSNLVTGIADENADFEKLIDDFVDSVGTTAENIIPRVEKALEGAGKLVERIVPVIINRIPAIVENTLPKILQSGVNIIRTILNGISSNPNQIVSTVMNVVNTLIDAIVDLLPDIIVTGALILGKLAVGIINAIPELVAEIPQIVTAIVRAFNSKSGEFINIGKNIIAGIKNGIKRVWNDLASWFRGLFGDLIGIAKKILGIASPSKVFKKIGGFTAEGFGIGFGDEFARVKDDMKKALTFEEASIGINASIERTGAGQGAFGSNNGGVSIVQNIYSEAKTAADLMQEAIYQQERAVLLGV